MLLLCVLCVVFFVWPIRVNVMCWFVCVCLMVVVVWLCCGFLPFVFPCCVVFFVCAVLDDGLLIVLVCVVTLLLSVFLYMLFYLCALCA